MVWFIALTLAQLYSGGAGRLSNHRGRAKRSRRFQRAGLRGGRRDAPRSAGLATSGRSRPAGTDPRETAEALALSSATVKTQVNRILYKTGARDRAQAVRYVCQHVLASLPGRVPRRREHLLL